MSVKLRFLRYLYAALVLAVLVALQPVVWLPSIVESAGQFQDTAAPSDLRPGPVVAYEMGGRFETASDWIQSTGEFSRRVGSGSLVLAGLPPDARVFANGILLNPELPDRGDIQVFPISSDYLQNGNNRFDVIHRERVALNTQLTAFARTGNDAWRVHIYGQLAETARFLVAILSLGLATLFLGGFVRSAGWPDLGLGMLCLGVGLAGSPQLIVSALNLPEFVGISARWFAIIPATAILVTIRKQVQLATSVSILAILCFAAAVAVPVSTGLSSTLSPWPAVFDAAVVALALSLLILIGLDRTEDVIHFFTRLVLQVRQRNSIISQQQNLIAQQAETLEAEIRKRAVLEERARFARDMHDGLGGNLLSLLVEVRSGKVSPERIESALENNLDDMRLMIDSLDHADRSLATALSTFQTRIRPMFEASAIALNWSQPDRTRLPSLSPEAVLNLLRVLQEAASNIVRHSDADRAEFVFEVPPEGGLLRLSISDNGTPSPGKTPDEVRPTSGIRNMAKRIEALNGTFSAGAGEGAGWEIRASIPF